MFFMLRYHGNKTSKSDLIFPKHFITIEIYLH